MEAAKAVLARVETAGQGTFTPLCRSRDPTTARLREEWNLPDSWTRADGTPESDRSEIKAPAATPGPAGETDRSDNAPTARPGPAAAIADRSEITTGGSGTAANLTAPAPAPAAVLALPGDAEGDALLRAALADPFVRFKGAGPNRLECPDCEQTRKDKKRGPLVLPLPTLRETPDAKLGGDGGAVGAGVGDEQAETDLHHGAVVGRAVPCACRRCAPGSPSTEDRPMTAMDDVRTAIDCLTLWEDREPDPAAAARIKQIIDDKGTDSVIPGFLLLGSLLLAQMAKDHGVTGEAERRALSRPVTGTDTRSPLGGART
ncbi:hypothetical protein ACIRPK_36325 [Kitasatospora sp. NPDC101801]|uniref:hypothetical protein n=1 Tax=Kitasatospora sp. NPDC101801 TaxID=3364103 RepID=UPI0038058995